MKLITCRLVFRQEIFDHVLPTCAKCLRSTNGFDGSYCKGKGYTFRLVSPSNIAEWAIPSENSRRTSGAIQSEATWVAGQIMDLTSKSIIAATALGRTCAERTVACNWTRKIQYRFVSSIPRISN